MVNHQSSIWDFLISSISIRNSLVNSNHIGLTSQKWVAIPPTTESIVNPFAQRFGRSISSKRLKGHTKITKIIQVSDNYAKRFITRPFQVF